MAISNGVNIAPIQVTAANRHGRNFKHRGRSNSIVKVEEIDETQEQMLDQSMYVNMNVEWVNRKGQYHHTDSPDCLFQLDYRGLAHPPGSHSYGHGTHRQHSWNDPSNKLDLCKPPL
jgi:hypothetical protein